MVSFSDANDFIERQLDDRIRAIEECLEGDAIAYSGPLIGGVDDVIRDTMEYKANQQPLRERLIFLLTTNGGYIETVARIVETLRHHYEYVEFIIPNRAFSAGTVLALSGNAIHMDYYSRLGPIDPQVESETGDLLPALGYLSRYETLIQRANEGTISHAEVAVLLKFDQAELYKFEQARELSIALLKEWLANYKFKEWKRTEGRGATVTKQMRSRRATNIAKRLNDTDRWHSHGYGISMDILSRDMKLKIDDFGSKKELSNSIRGYHQLFEDYSTKRGIDMSLHVFGRFIAMHFHHH